MFRKLSKAHKDPKWSRKTVFMPIVTCDRGSGLNR